MEYYLDAKNWKVELLDAPRPGLTRIPPVAALALAPIIGGIFVVFMPAMGLWMVTKSVAEKAADGVNYMVRVARRLR